MKYKIVVEYYANTKDLEANNPIKVADSGFTKDLSLLEAQILKSKMNDDNPLRVNRIVKAD